MLYNINMKWLLVMVLLPSLVYASENCVTQYKGTCKDVCSQNEEPADGAFIDCSEKQECCVSKPGPDKVDVKSGSEKETPDHKKQ
jgi:hypothetical protein